ncbi:hypothetical protein Y1Q_0011815 [Alligator mississippiensis]|uniref:Ig-like domain-containing protein n=1 Tax=Alligator mississippiensis TaxID=8496 RepID=A0A151MRI0_ALLMI|nr:hypothetical protein Y1Q_0011815 [Alligator mississippiensis]
MEGLGVLLFLAVCSGASSQIQLTQSRPEVRKPGESVKLSCKASGYTFTDYSMNWGRVCSQVQLLQATAAQEKPSGTLRLTCAVSGFSLTASGSVVSWIRQPPGKGLEWLCLIFWNDYKYYQDSMKSRLTISQDTSKSEVYLELRGLEARDSGTYYCAKAQ